MNTNSILLRVKLSRSLKMDAKEWMQSMAKAFGKYEYKVKYQNDKGMVELKSPGWRDDPPKLKAYKAIDCILPEFLRAKKQVVQKDVKKKVIKQLTKFKDIE
jgi:hypothetical protein